MAKKIEIFENTLLKLLIRRGTDQERQTAILSEGELGYTTDTKRVYVGDGQTPGGIVVGGTSFLGSAADVPSTFVNAAVGDTAFDSDDNVMYTYLGGGQTNPNNWASIGGTYSSGDNTITVTNTNQIKVNQVAAGNFNTNVAGNSIEVDSNGKIALTSEVNINRIAARTGDTLTIPSKFTVQDAPASIYTWPVGGVGNNLFLGTDLNGNLTWSSPFNSTSFVAGTASQIPVGSIMPFISAAAAPSGWLLCNGQSVPGASYRALSAVIGTSYGGNGVNFNVPDLRNKMLYGVAGSPATSTTFSIMSGFNSSLSAAGALYIIKAKPDEVVNSTITIQSPLTATLNGASVTNVTKSALSGNFVIGMPPSLIVDTILDLIYPIGSVILTTTSTDPNTRFPGTSWSQVSEGLFLAGVGTGTDKNGVSQEIEVGDLNSSLGEYTHKLSSTEIPYHTHVCDSVANHTHNATTALTYTTTNNGTYNTTFVSTTRTLAHPGTDAVNGLSRGADFADVTSSSISRAGITATTSLGNAGGHSHNIGYYGGNGVNETIPHNNMPPCYGVYVWERIS